MPVHRLKALPLGAVQSLKARTYDALKAAIVEMNIYAPDAELKLDERNLSQRLGISRTPLREALALLDRDGIVKTISRRGVFIVKKSKREAQDLITVWAAIESLAAGQAATSASDAENGVMPFERYQGPPPGWTPPPQPVAFLPVRPWTWQ